MNAPFDEGMVIDGVHPVEWIAPATAAELAGALADAAARDLVVAPVGGGSSLALGNLPERVDLAVSTANLNQILDYEPTDLTLSVGAGARFADVLATLEEQGQTLPLDVADPERATIGGLIATALAGPRRLGSGTLRDLIIGAEVALPNGTLAKAGGLVVKNVTGFDLMRLYHGSLGTLGVIVSANFKVLPMARVDATSVVACDSLDTALDLTDTIRHQRLQPISLEAFWQAGQWSVAARFAGRERAVAQRKTQVRSLATQPVEQFEGAAGRDWWQAYMQGQALDRSAADEMLVRWSVRPSETPALVRRVVEVAEGSRCELIWLGASVGLGTVVGRLRFTEDDDGSTLLAGWQQQWQAMADHVQILAAPPAWKRGIDVWGRVPETIDLMRGLKEQFDPRRILNRGRFVGHL